MSTFFHIDVTVGRNGAHWDTGNYGTGEIIFILLCVSEYTIIILGISRYYK